MNTIPGIPVPRTRAAQSELDRFMHAYGIELSRGQEIPLSVLVWGPTPDTDTPVARKRAEIRNTLIEQGHNAMFSEDIPQPRGVPSTLTEDSKELAQARCAHLIIALIEGS